MTKDTEDKPGLAPSKSTGALVPDTQTGVLSAPKDAPDSGSADGKVTITVTGGAAKDGKKAEFTADFFDGDDLQSVFSAVKNQFDAMADEKAKAASQNTAKALANTTGVTEDNKNNTPESKGRTGEVFLSDSDALRAELAAQNEAKKASKKDDKSDKK